MPDLFLTLDELMHQASIYESNLNKALIAVEQIKGSLAATKNHISLVLKKQSDKNLENENATKEGSKQENDSSEHQDGDSGGEAPKASSGDSV